jgi:single-strand DNA-binding protein
MLFVNEVRLMGNMGNAPEFNTYPSGDPYCVFSVATTEYWTDKATTQKHESTTWTRVKVRDRNTVEYLKQYAAKGSRVYVEGKLRTSKFTDNGGVERLLTEVDANRVSLESRRSDNADDQPQPEQAPAPQAQRARAANTNVRQQSNQSSGLQPDNSYGSGMPRF